MKVITAIRHYRLYGIYFLFAVLPLRGDCLTLRAVFDALFPSTPFKMLLINSMRLQGMLDTLSKQSNEGDKKQMQEIISASFAQLERSVDALGKERIKCRTQDLEYLLIVLDSVAIKAHEALAGMQSSERALFVQQIIMLQEKLDKTL